jgi:hypothetical protein
MPNSQPNLLAHLLRSFADRVPDGYHAEGFVPLPGSEHVVDLRYRAADGSLYIMRVDARNEKVLRTEHIEPNQPAAREYGPVLQAPSPPSNEW